MLKPADNYFDYKPEPLKSCLEFLRAHILGMNQHITETWNYGMPFYSYKGKRFAYLWVHKKFKQPYIGIVDGNLVDHPDLLQEKRARMKILLVDPTKNIPVKKINAIMKQVFTLYQYPL